MKLHTRFFIVFAMLVLVPSLMIISLTRDRFADIITESSVQKRDMLTDQVITELETAQNRVAVFSQKLLGQLNSTDFVTDAQNLEQLRQSQNDIAYIGLASPAGKAIIESGRSIPVPKKATVDSLAGTTLAGTGQQSELVWVEALPWVAPASGEPLQVVLAIHMPGLERLIQNTRRNAHIMILLQDSNGTLLGSNATPGFTLPPVNTQNTKQVEWNNQPFQLETHALNESLNLLILIPNRQQEQLSEKLYSQLSSVGVVALIVGMLVIQGMISTQVTHPLSQIQSMIRNIMEGRISSSSLLKRTDEMGDLAKNLESMRKHLQETSHQIEELAYFDTLTGLPNKVNLIDTIQKLIEKSKQTGYHIAVLFFDLDNFKHINDGLGHEHGDALLMQVSSRLKESIRSHDVVSKTARDLNTEGDSIVARLGGDEFTVVLSKLGSPEEAAKVAERILTRLSESFHLKQSEVFISASVGIALYPQDGKNPESLLKHADLAMYAAKTNGKSNYRFYDSQMNKPVMERIELESSMRSALQNQEFLLHFQPKIPLSGAPRYEYETLMRWQHGTRGMISPGLFIPMAEDCGYIQNLGDWVIEQSCQQIEFWNKQGISPLTVSVNLSPVQLNYGTPLQTIKRCLSTYKIQPEQLEIEITESGLMQNEKHAITLLKEIKQLGVRIALDDFGTGYSSLAYLLRFPIDTLKIDRAFIQDIEHNPKSLVVLESIIALAKQLKLDVVAEGVETEEQFNLLRSRDCDYIQGFYFSKPVVADAAMNFVKNYFQRPAAMPTA